MFNFFGGMNMFTEGREDREAVVGEQLRCGKNRCGGSTVKIA
ncbi:MAG: hypothetical protein U1G05_17540 [Kiritimatiellia bacterium]